MSEEQNRFSLRKLSVGLASVLIGVSIFGTSQTVKADTVANNQTSSVTNNAQSSDTQKNENAVKSTFSSITPYNNVKNNATQTQDKAKNDQTDSLNQNPTNSQEANNSNDLQEKSAEKNIVRTSSLQEPDNQSNYHAKDNSQSQTSQKLDLTKNSKKFAKKVLATNLIETTSSPMTNGGFDEATWGKLDVNDWQGQAENGFYQLTNYTGDFSHIIVPNEADFEQAGKSINGLQVGITRDTAQLLRSYGQTIAFSKTNNEKVKAIGADWSYVFSNIALSKFDGSNLDVSGVTDINHMFENNSISDLTSLAHWNVSNVTDMYMMFTGNKISDLTPLSHWDTSKVTVMSGMFGNNPDLIDVKPIANWNISSVNNDYGLSYLFSGDTKLDLTNINNTPLMQGLLKKPDALVNATYITNNAALVKATTGKDLSTLTNTAKRTITFNIPHAEPKIITQIINYKDTAPAVQVNFDFDSPQIVKTFAVKESDWQLDTSKQNDDVIIDGVINFKPVTIPHVNGYKAHLVRNPLNPAMFMVSFIAVPSETKPSISVEEAPSKPSALVNNTNKPANDLQQRVVTELNSNDSGWTMPENTSTYTVEVPADDATIDLSDLVIAEPVHAQTRTQIRVTKRFKLRKHGKKHVAKHLKHRKKAVKSFKKYRL